MNREPADKHTFGEHSQRSDVWSLGGRVLAQLIQVLGFAVLSRMLDARLFGVVAAAAIFIGFAQIFSELGINSAVVSRQDLSSGFLSSAFWLNGAAGLCCAAVLSFTASPISTWLGYRELAWLIPILSATLPLSFGAVAAALLERSFRFRAVAAGEIISAICAQSVSIFTAATGAGLVSLAIMQPVYVLVSSSLAMVLARWRPRFYVSWHDLREIAAFVIPLLGANSVNYSARSADNLLVAKMFTAETLAYYARAYQLMLAPVMQATLALGRVYQAALASEYRSRHRMEIRYRYAAADVASFGALVSVLVAPNSTRIVTLILGDQWFPMAPLLAILSLSIAPQVVTSLNGAALRAARSTKLLWWLGLTNSGTLMVALFIAAFCSIYAIAWTIVFHAFLVMIPTVYCTCRHLGFAFGGVLIEVGRALSIPLLLGLVQALANAGFPTDSSSVELVKAAVAVVCVLLCVFATRRRSSRMNLELRMMGERIRTGSA